MSKHTVIRWTQSPDQDFARDNRGWPKGKRRKWSETTEASIRALHNNLVEDAEEFFYGATAIIHQRLSMLVIPFSTSLNNHRY